MSKAALARYHQQLRSLGNSRMRMEGMCAAGTISREDVEIAYESLFLRAVVGYEQLCELLFTQCLHRQTQFARSRARLKFSAISREAARDIVLQDKQYLDWIPYEKMEKTVRRYLQDGKPFTNVRDTSKQMLAKITALRHAIAHGSEYSLGKFKTQVIGNQITGLLPHEQTPAGFLRSITSGSTTRFEVYLSELGSIAREIVS